jgi:hypothetical protein
MIQVFRSIYRQDLAMLEFSPGLEIYLNRMVAQTLREAARTPKLRKIAEVRVLAYHYRGSKIWQLLQGYWSLALSGQTGILFRINL